MADNRFFTLSSPLTLGQLAEITGSELSDPVAAGREIVDVAPLQDADATKLSFLDNKKYADAFKASKAGACIVRPEFAEFAPEGMVCLKNKNPYMAYAIAATAFYPEEKAPEYRAPSAVIDPTAQIGSGCYIGHGVVIGANVKIGKNCRLQSHAVIKRGVEIGDNADIGPHCFITHALIGNGVRLYPGVVIGRPGFGFAMAPTGFVSVPQLGRVIIGDDVEIGANTTIDRGAGPDTVIGQGTRIDNLVQVGHNVKIGKFCVIAAQTGISGSTQFGDFVMAGGQSGFAGHLNIGAGAKIAAQSGIMRDVPPKSDYMGTPAVPIRQFLRQSSLMARMADKKGNDDK